jgi:hypothetical protein
MKAFSKWVGIIGIRFIVIYFKMQARLTRIEELPPETVV